MLNITTKFREKYATVDLLRVHDVDELKPRLMVSSKASSMTQLMSGASLNSCIRVKWGFKADILSI